MTGPPHVVLLTGGYRPGWTAPEPHTVDLARLDDDRAAALLVLARLAGRDPGEVAGDPEAGRAVLDLTVAAWREGFRQAGHWYRVHAAFMLPGAGKAEEFAAHLTRDVDPAYALPASDPLGELLRFAARTRKETTP